VSTLAARLAHLPHLPREARDTLFLLAVMAGTMAPHVLNVPGWCSLMAGAVLAWRAWLAIAGRPLPNRWVVTGLLLLAGALTFAGERTMLGKEAGVTMLVVLMSLKTLELRARRDALVVFFLGFFLVLTQFLYSQALWVGLWMLPALWGLLTALVLANMPVGRPSIRRAGAAAARATLLGVPLMALLFVLFPRIGPLWGLPQDAVGRTGLSGSLRLGGVASVAEDDSIALRVRFEGASPLPDQLYFRGPVLSQYDGREWTRLVPTVPVAERARADFRLLGAPLRYEMILEPSRLPLLPLLEATPDRAGAAPVVDNLLVMMRPDAQWQTDRPLDQRVRLQAVAWMQHHHGPFQPVPGLRDHLRLPPGVHPRTRAWAETLRSRAELAGADASALAAAVMQHIASGGYIYTLEPGTYEGDSIDEFWFDRKAGFCEHFASAFVVVMRAMGVPARLVTGYQGADPELQDGWMVVRQRNAHAWAEYWQAERGWLRADPTAAVAPTRVQAGRSLRPPPGLVEGALGTIDPALAQRLRAAWETMNNRWNQWVLNYSRSQQFDLLRSLGLRHPDWNTLAQVLVGVLCALALAGAAWAWWDRRRQDPWQRLQARVAERLARHGVQVLPHESPLARALRVRQVLGVAGEPLAAELEALARARYRDTAWSGRQWWRRFAALRPAG
jgi:protein-glutamine gamma-glutamyltransferase